MTISWDQLSAYVDGELDATGRAKVATALARDPDLAARVASLSQLKAAASAVRPADVSGAPPFVLPRRPATRISVRARQWAAMAAALVVAIFSGAAVYSWSRAVGPGMAGLEQAGAMHGVWMNTSRLSAGATDVQMQFGPHETVRVPDLGEAKLKLVYQAFERDQARRPAVFIGYLGPNGCRLGLWIGRHPGGAVSRPMLVRVGELDSYVWSNGRYDYAIVAKGMDQPRLGSLATIIANIIERDHHLDEQLQVALRGSAMTGTVCST